MEQIGFDPSFKQRKWGKQRSNRVAKGKRAMLEEPSLRRDEETGAAAG